METRVSNLKSVVLIVLKLLAFYCLTDWFTAHTQTDAQSDKNKIFSTLDNEIH